MLEKEMPNEQARNVVDTDVSTKLETHTHNMESQTESLNRREAQADHRMEAQTQTALESPTMSMEASKDELEAQDQDLAELDGQNRMESPSQHLIESQAILNAVTIATFTTTESNEDKIHVDFKYENIRLHRCMNRKYYGIFNYQK